MKKCDNPSNFERSFENRNTKKEKIMTVDQASINQLNLLHPKLKDIAIECYNAACLATPVGVHPYIVQSYRTFEESDHLYKLGRTEVNPDGKTAAKPFGNVVSNAKAGQSWHNWGLAIDFGLKINGKVSYDVDHNWMTVVKIFKEKGFNWGGEFTGSFKDYPHLEAKLGQTLGSLNLAYSKGKFIPGTKYINF